MSKNTPVPDDSCSFDVTAPVRLPGESNAQAVFQWMLTNRYLWMLESGENADRVEAALGTARLIRLAGLGLRWQWEDRGRRHHPALQAPADADGRERAFRRLRRFLELHIDLDEPFSAAPADQRRAH